MADSRAPFARTTVCCKHCGAVLVVLPIPPAGRPHGLWVPSAKDRSRKRLELNGLLVSVPLNGSIPSLPIPYDVLFLSIFQGAKT